VAHVTIHEIRNQFLSCAALFGLSVPGNTFLSRFYSQHKGGGRPSAPFPKRLWGPTRL